MGAHRPSYDELITYYQYVMGFLSLNHDSIIPIYRVQGYIYLDTLP
ncbi:hypothetical protein [Bacillus toyonensis]|nr:hypothetical protein [Bacillus toyonensis]